MALSCKLNTPKIMARYLFINNKLKFKHQSVCSQSMANYFLNNIECDASYLNKCLHVYNKNNVIT